MRALLDTNILIYREAPVVVRQNIGRLFRWLDRLGYDKLVHPVSLEEIDAYEDENIRKSFTAKIQSYKVLKVQAEMHRDVKALSDRIDRIDNDRNDSKLLNELYVDRADLIITEDRAMARKAEILGIIDRLFTIDGFLEKAYSENPEQVDYDILAVQKTLFGLVSVENPFFDSFREDYVGFNEWFSRKSEEPCYVCLSDDETVAFLYLKLEDEREPYHDIAPQFLPGRRLKIGTFKVELNGFRIGERFLKIVFDNAIIQRVQQIYVTIFGMTVEQDRLIRLLEDFGFEHHGTKVNPYGEEQVYVRDMTPTFATDYPRLSFPFVAQSTRHYLVPIYPEYHTELLPDSILNTESPDDFIENAPHRNAITKVYVSRSYFRALEPGDVIIFYRTGGYYKSVVTTLGIVEAVHLNIQDEGSFIRLCRKRSVFSNAQLREHWRYSQNRPFIVEFLYAYSFPRRPNMATLIENGVIQDVNSAPRGFERITHDQFDTIIELSQTDTRFIVD